MTTITTLPSSSPLEGNTGMTSVANTVLLAREDSCWVGPIEVVTDTDVIVQFAVVPQRMRPQDADWTDPVQSPDDPTKLGVLVGAVTSDGQYGIWVKGSRDALVVILEPPQVGYIYRT
jgi:hypothetical protein